MMFGDTILLAAAFGYDQLNNQAAELEKRLSFIEDFTSLSIYKDLEDFKLLLKSKDEAVLEFANARIQELTHRVDILEAQALEKKKQEEERLKEAERQARRSKHVIFGLIEGSFLFFTLMCISSACAWQQWSEEHLYIDGSYCDYTCDSYRFIIEQRDISITFAIILLVACLITCIIHIICIKKPGAIKRAFEQAVEIPEEASEEEKDPWFGY